MLAELFLTVGSFYPRLSALGKQTSEIYSTLYVADRAMSDASLRRRCVDGRVKPGHDCSSSVASRRWQSAAATPIRAHYSLIQAHYSPFSGVRAPFSLSFESLCRTETSAHPPNLRLRRFRQPLLHRRPQLVQVVREQADAVGQFLRRHLVFVHHPAEGLFVHGDLRRS
jgi:hypothetical protein